MRFLLTVLVHYPPSCASDCTHGTVQVPRILEMCIGMVLAYVVIQSIVPVVQRRSFKKRSWLLGTIGCRRGQASSSSGSKARWSLEKAKYLFILIEQEDC